MRSMRANARWLMCACVLAGCATHRHALPPEPAPPPDIAAHPDAVPKAEPRASKGNPPFYNVFGKRYFVLPSADGYVERGVASWYGPGFHAGQTAMGEPYDMYAMTAAHKTLPLPTYVNVTNLTNGRSIVVRVNDRGPFKDGRIIDLSRTAAEKLGMVRDGTAFVEVRAITPGLTPTTTSAPTKPNELYVQAGAFAVEPNASRLAAKLRSEGYEHTFVKMDEVAGRKLFRVRIGPIATVDEFDRVLAQLKSLGVPDAQLALD